METSSVHIAIHPRGDATHYVNDLGGRGELLGVVRLGPPYATVATIQSTDPDHLLQLAEQLTDAAYAMDPSLRSEVPA